MPVTATKPKSPVASKKRRRSRRSVGKGVYVKAGVKSKTGVKSGSLKAKSRTPMTARLEARVTELVYDTIKRAAELRGLSISAYVTGTIEEQARMDIEAIELIRLTRAEQIRFAEALLEPPAPTETLARAFARYEELYGRE